MIKDIVIKHVLTFDLAILNSAIVLNILSLNLYCNVYCFATCGNRIKARKVRGWLRVWVRV